MAEFHFLRPDWLWLLLPALILVWLVLRTRTGTGGWADVVASHLLPYVVRQSATGTGFRKAAGAAAALGTVLALLALAGPTWDRIPTPTMRSGEALAVVLDLSRSMDAADLEPSRLARAKLKLLNILEQRPNGQTALVVFSAHAFTVTPLTDDVATIAALVGSLSTDIMPSQGSYPETGLAKATALFEQGGIARGDVLLVTDSDVTSPLFDEVRKLREAGHRVSVLGVGTRSGGPISKGSGGFVTDRSGNVVVTRLDALGLARLAAEGGGRYSGVTTDNADIEYLLSNDEAGFPHGGEDTALETRLWKDRGPYLVLLLLPLALLGFRRGLIVVMAWTAVLPDTTQAASWQDLWRTPDQQAASAMAAGEHAVAAELFEDPRWKSAAQYRSGDFEASAEALKDLDDPDSHYNRGNALARNGDFQSALAAYQRALELDPAHEDAAYNRDVLLENMPPQQQQGGGQGDDSQQQQDPQSQQDQQGSEPQQGEQQNDGQQQSPQQEQESEGQQGEQQASSESLDDWASEQAADQWLRRIPDDPGGLLRRKFRYQYQRLGRDQDGNSVWPGDEERPY